MLADKLRKFCGRVFKAMSTASEAYSSSLEASRVYREVEKRKEMAERLGLRDLFERLYFHNIQYYPSWIKRGYRYVSPLVAEAVQIEEKALYILLKGKKYTFRFTERRFSTPDGESLLHGLLELFFEDHRLLALKAAFNYQEEYGEPWSIFDVEVFVVGNWVEDFQELSLSIERQAKERERQDKEDPIKLAKLKNNFGIK